MSSRTAGWRLGLLLTVFWLAPSSIRAEEPPAAKPTREDPAKDGNIGGAKPDSGQPAPAPPLTADELKKALEKYDANGNGKLDDDELAKMKADEQIARKAAAEEDKMNQKDEKRAGQKIKKANKPHKAR